MPIFKKPPHPLQTKASLLPTPYSQLTNERGIFGKGENVLFYKAHSRL